jgi:hypothetical protein
VTVALSPDGEHLYVTGRTSDQLVVFSRNTADGLLSEVASYQDGVDGFAGLNDPHTAFVSDDGRNVYILNAFFGDDSRIASFARAADGTLSFLGEVREGEGGVSGIRGPRALIMSADGADAYVLARSDSRVVHLRRRASDGLLQFESSNDYTGVFGFGLPNALTFDASGALLYVAGTQGFLTLSRSDTSGVLSVGSVSDAVNDVKVLRSTGDDNRIVAWERHRLRIVGTGPFIVSPADGSTLVAQSTEFTWNANGVPAAGWRLLVGSSRGARDYCDSRNLPRAARAVTCTGLPRQGEPLFATVQALLDGGVQTTTAEYTAGAFTLPVLASPSPGANIVDSQVFTLDAQGNDIIDWRITAGTSPGARNLFNRRLAGNASEFTINNLPADQDVFVSVEVRGTFGRETTVYQYNPSSEVLPMYPRFGARWASYVRAGADELGGSDRACTSSTRGAREACLHGGEHRVFVVPGVLSCDGVTAEDAIGAFDWACSEDMMPVRVVSTGLKPDMHLSDLLVFAPPDFQLNSVTVNHSGTTTSDPTRWWDNPLENADAGGLLANAETVYVTNQPQPDEPFLIQRRRSVSLVVNPVKVVAQAVTPGEALVRLDRADFAWVEGALDATGASFGVKVSRGAWIVLDNVGITGADTLATGEFAGVATAGIALDRSRNALLRGVSTDGTGDAGIALSAVTGSRLENLGASRAGTGVLLNRSSGNRLQHLVLSGHDEGLVLQDRSLDNVVAETTSSNNFGDGVVIAGRSDGNRLLQVLSRHNRGSGVLLDGSLGTALLGVTALDNDMHGVELVGAQRSVLSAMALGNNGGDGLMLSAARDNRVMDIAAAHNAGAGVRLADGSVRNVFEGELRVGNNTGHDECVVETGSTGLVTGCVSGAAEPVVTSGITLADSFFGALGEDELFNESDDGGMALFADTTDWLAFENRWRAWGRGVEFVGPFTRGACDLGEACLIWDARLLDGDTGATGAPSLADVLPIPTVDDVITQRMRRNERFLAFARELLGDGVGNDDGLCEAGEDCLVMPHLGAFQGEGDLQDAGTLSNGIRLLRAPQ